LQLVASEVVAVPRSALNDVTVIVRRRTEEDVDRCLQLARIVRDLDGYPPYLPTDLRGFIVTMDAAAAWVAERDGAVLGHVALHPRTSGTSPRIGLGPSPLRAEPPSPRSSPWYAIRA
jgi:hypothetical protein